MNLPVKQIDTLMGQEMSRQEFLKFLGVGVLSMVGVWSFIKNLEETIKPHTNTTRKVESGYGSSAYGR